MKNLILTLLLFIFVSISTAKENSFFVGTKLSNGKLVDAVKYTYLNGEKRVFREKSYYLGNLYVFGGTIKNISISSGIGYSLYRYKNQLAYIDIWEPFRFRNSHLISIPVNIDYNINIFKNKLFATIGTGVEYTITMTQKYKFNNNHDPGYKTTFKYNDLREMFRLHSVIISVRCGLLYSINKRIDIFSTFDFGYYATDYLRGTLSGSSKDKYNYILSNSIGLNIKFGKNIKKEKKDKEESAKTISYKTPQRFLSD